MTGPTTARGRSSDRLHAVVRQTLATLLATTALGVVAAHAADGVWIGGTTNWTNAANWSSNPSVPDGTASFVSTGSTAVDNNSGAVTIGTILFTSAVQASSVTIGNAFTVNGSGIINNSSNTQNFEVTAGKTLTF